MGQHCSHLPRKLLLLGADVRQGGQAGWPDSRGVCTCCLGREGLVDVGDAFFVAALVQVLKRGEVGQVGLEFVTECWPDGSGVAIGGVELSDGLVSHLCGCQGGTEC